MLNFTNELECQNQLDVFLITCEEIDHYRLSTQLYILKTKFIDSNQKPVPAVINYMKNKISCTNNFSPYFFKKLYLVSPAANDISERSASSMCRSKN